MYHFRQKSVRKRDTPLIYMANFVKFVFKIDIFVLDIFDQIVVQDSQRCIEKRTWDFNNQSKEGKHTVDYKRTSEIGLVTQ